ncbi:hypothetical protein N7G274_008596 [Stereocaulon virgatum]|uniref:CorA-like transporter domain-containing protein n=1 Tax=Stereocaulon virgatum TaxID=373712 RepID=A0ABR3ZXX8_9LECA
MFKAICNFDRVTPRFLSIIFGLGRKTASFDENFMTCYRNFSIRPEKKGKGMKYEDGYMCEDQSRQNLYESYDICYNIRHFELHRRDLDDPWSCRQSAIHQKYYFANGHSKWMIVHPPTLFGESLKDTDFGKIAHPLGLHLRYLAAGAANWREYLNLISEKLTDLDRKVSFPKSLKDFDVDFSFGQQVHVLSRKLSHAHLILENTLDTISSLKLFADKVTQMTNSSRSVVDSFQSELQDISSELRSYLLTSRKLLDFSEDIKLMNNDILRFRDQELLYENGIKLAQIAQSNALVNKIMVMLATNTAGDSRTMRIATIVALFYLPASFTMTFFSSSLVEINVASNSRKGDKGAPGMYVHHEIWVAILTILVLASLTFLPAIYWDRRGKRRTNTVTFGA